MVCAPAIQTRMFIKPGAACDIPENRSMFPTATRAPARQEVAIIVKILYNFSNLGLKVQRFMEKPGKTKQLFFLTIFIGLILVFFAAVEIVLRAVGYGYSTEPFVKPRNMPEVYIENTQFANKYFSRKVDFSVFNNRSIFDVKKPKNFLRGFMIGESSAQGYPFESNHSFGKIAEVILDNLGKYEHVEIMNLGFSGLSSYYLKDTAKKLLKYEPDFILIYAGHNEYYGEIGEAAGGTPLTKNVYLALKEWKVFQLIFDVVYKLTYKKDDSKTLMAAKYNKIKLPQNSALDKRVALQFIENLDSILKEYSVRKIPVVVIEPVYNLYDMPPFAGGKDTENLAFIQKYKSVFQSGDRAQMKALFKERLSHKEYDSNANIVYLDALYQQNLSGVSALSNLIAAKDMDVIPFRTRSGLIQELRDYYQEKTNTYKNLYYIPLFSVLTNRYGEKVLGNQIFIDHLHFNMKGQLAVGKIVTEKVEEIFNFNPEQKQKAEKLFQGESSLLTGMGYLPVYEMIAYGSIKDILNDAPYKSMLIPYVFDNFPLLKNEILNNEELMKLIVKDAKQKGGSAFRLVRIVENYYFKREDLKKYYQHLIAGAMLYPGSFLPYYSLALFFSASSKNENLAKDFFTKAYLLSDKKKDIYKDFEFYFKSDAQKIK
jgi:lysophospholipase L1-like esterase